MTKQIHLYFNSLLILACFFLACNTEKFRPKPAEIPISQSDVPKQKTVAEEHANEEIGPASLGYDNVDESGNGIYGRMIANSFYDKVEKIKQDADPNLKGTLKIIVCIDQQGIIQMARPDIQKTTMNNLDLQRKVGKVLIDQRFDKDPTAPERQCGLVVVDF